MTRLQYQFEGALAVWVKEAFLVSERGQAVVGILLRGAVSPGKPVKVLYHDQSWQGRISKVDTHSMLDKAQN